MASRNSRGEVYACHPRLFSELLIQTHFGADLLCTKSMTSSSRLMPCVSIIIPNFNNGRANAHDGARDFLAELFASIASTLQTERVSFEILVADDGSTDDSLATARAWSKKLRADGLPFLRLIELQHCGVLSSVLNRLLAEAKGEYIARLDGDIVLKSPNWLTALVDAFERDAHVGVVTGVQLLSNGRVHAFGDDLFGPRGYRHIARGAPIASLPSVLEVDHAMGCFYCTRRAVESTAGLYDEAFLRGQTEEYGVRVRKAGWKVNATNAIVFEHWHMERHRRANTADASNALDTMLSLFHAKHGFDRLAPDLRDVLASAEGTPMLRRDLALGNVDASTTEVTALSQDPRAQSRLAEEIAAVVRAKSAHADCVPLLIGCGAGILPRALATHGVRCIAVEREGEACAMARLLLGRASSFVHGVHDFASLPFDDASQQCIIVTGVLERYWNPVGLLKELRRVLAPHGSLVLRSAIRQDDAMEDATDARHTFTVTELRDLLQHSGVFTLAGEARYFEKSATLEVPLVCGGTLRGRGYFSSVPARASDSLQQAPSTAVVLAASV
ncbi:MAG: glycosyltransferase [Phycisphaerales bacterium]|nr:glycosyltransferase [Phycisphaerales bacterium]